jgi:glucuronoarabinoxylan endo-1,4-beta-xylanase
VKSHPSDHASLSRSPSALEELEPRMMLYSASVGVNTGTTFQTMDGFGAAMMTWSSPSEYSSAAFYDRIVNDLGATIARTAIWPTFENGNDNADPNTFNWAEFDESAIAQAMTFMKRLQDRGMKNLLASVWTPPAWMKTNQSHYYGGTVRPDLRSEFAENVAAAMISAKRDFGVDISHLSIQNEPFFVQSYESTTYTAVQMREAIRAVMRKFSAEGLGTKLAIPEEMAKLGRYGWYADAIRNDPETRNFSGVFATHSAQNPAWAYVRDAVAGSGKNLWTTESHGHAQTIQGALAMAQDMWNSLTLSNSSAYLYWQWSEDPGSASHSLMVNGQPAIKYHVAKHFYRYVRPGAIRIGATSSDARLRSVSFKQPSNGALTHVMFNANDAPATVTLNLSGSGLPSSYKVYRTSGTENHVQLANVSGGSQVTVTLPAQSIVTLYSGPDLQPVTATSGGPLPARHGLADGATTNALRIAAAQGDVGEVRELIDNQGADPNASAFGGFTPLHAAAMAPYAGAVEVIHALIDRGANVSAKTADGFTPLHIAAMNAWTRGDTQEGPLSADRIRALAARGASVNALDNQGRTPLHWGAMMTKLNDIIDMTQDRVHVDALLDVGGSINAKDNKGFTPLDYAYVEGNTAGFTELKNRGGVHGAGGPTGDTTPPTANVIDVSPDPRTTAVSSIDVVFSEPVTGVSLGDFILMRDGATLAMTGATLAQVNSTTWRVGNLASLTGTAGAYMFKLEKNNSGIVDGANNALATSASDSWTFGSVGSTPQAPFNGSPFAFGTGGGVTIQAEDYDLGGEGMAYHETTSNNIGNVYRPNEAVDVKLIANTASQYRLSDAAVGEWVEYSIQANNTATYELELRLSNADPNGRIHVEIDGVDVTGPITVPDTNNFSVFQSVKKQLNIAQGAHVLRVAFDVAASTGSVAGIDWMKINPLAVQQPGAVTIVSPIVSYVRDGSFANTNFGTDAEMIVKRNNTVGNSREGYVQFDLSGVNTISNAKLRLNGRLSGTTAPGGVAVNVHYAADDSWTEGGLTWNNKPAAGSLVRGSLTVTGTTAQWYEVDLTSFLQEELAAGRKVVTIVLKGPNVSDPWVSFATDSTANGPRLVLTP